MQMHHLRQLLNKVGVTRRVIRVDDFKVFKVDIHTIETVSDRCRNDRVDEVLQSGRVRKHLSHLVKLRHSEERCNISGVQPSNLIDNALRCHPVIQSLIRQVARFWIGGESEERDLVNLLRMSFDILPSVAVPIFIHPPRQPSRNRAAQSIVYARCIGRLLSGRQRHRRYNKQDDRHWSKQHIAKRAHS